MRASNALGPGACREVVSLVLAGLESALVEAQGVVRVASISPLSIWDAGSDLIRVAVRVKRLVVRCLKVVVHQATLLLLA